MQLKLEKRDTQRKREAKRIRRNGMIPACLYAHGKESESVMVSAAEFAAALRHIPKGHLPTTIFELKDGKKKRSAIVKDIQYHVTTYDVLHLDFEELIEDTPVNVKVPIECTGVVDCVGVKLGGVLRSVIRHVKVRCLPKEIPSSFKLDVQELGLKQTRRLRDIAIPEAIRPLMDLDEVAVVIAKR